MTIGPEDEVSLVDDAGHGIYKCPPEGEVLLTLGTPGKEAERQSGKPFNRPTKVAVCPRTGDLYIADGCGNSRIHRFDPSGRYLFSWGKPGTDCGHFNLPHSVYPGSGRNCLRRRSNH